MTGEKWVKHKIAPQTLAQRKGKKKLPTLLSQQKEQQGRENRHNHKHCPNMLEQKQRNKTKQKSKIEKNPIKKETKNIWRQSCTKWNQS